MTARIEGYGLIGDLETAALVSDDGSIDRFAEALAPQAEDVKVVITLDGS